MEKKNYFIEYKRYTIEELAKKLDKPILETEEIIKRLENRFIKSEVLDVSESGFIKEVVNYYFDYVGVIVEGETVIHCVPSFFLDDNNLNIHEEYSKVVKVIEKYYLKKKKDGTSPIYETYSRTDKSRKNYIELIIELLRDYLINGLYENDIEIIQDNGNGDIDWGLTVNEVTPIIIKNRPLYNTLKTLSRETDDSDFIKRLHLAIIFMGYNKLYNCGLADLLGISNIRIFGEDIYDIGSVEYLKQMIIKEKNIQYITRKLYVLDLMYSILNEYEKSKYALEKYNFGTKDFNYVWEDVCSVVISNHKNIKLNQLESVKNSINTKYINKSIMDVIEPVKWIWQTKDSSDNTQRNKMFERGKPNPDILLLRSVNGEIQMFILDAKYYNFHIDQKDICNNPGLSDVLKQYVYELSLKKFTDENNIAIYCNAFLFPSSKTYNNEKSYAIYNPLSQIGDLKLEKIKAIRVDASVFFDAYLNERLIDINDIIQE